MFFWERVLKVVNVLSVTYPVLPSRKPGLFRKSSS